MRTGFIFLGNRPALIARYGHELPVTLLDESNLPVIGDINESAAPTNWSAVAHMRRGGTDGAREGTSGALPQALGCEGSNITYLHGGVSWVPVDSLSLYRSSSTNNRYKSLWRIDE